MRSRNGEDHLHIYPRTLIGRGGKAITFAFTYLFIPFRAEPGAERRAQFRYPEEGVLLVFSRGKADPAIILAAALAYFSASRR